MKIYTRTGDKGTTSLYTGERVPKNNRFMEAIGTVDEANSTIGLALSFLPREAKFEATKKELDTIQNALFDVGAALATPRRSGSQQKLDYTRFDHDDIDTLEKWIDRMELELPQLKHFILPGGHPAGASLHLARSITRRAERAVVPLFEQGEVVENVLVYLNRLSDYLFVASRYVNHLLNLPETIWQK